LFSACLALAWSPLAVVLEPADYSSFIYLGVVALGSGCLSANIIEM